jgi:hypothetical protein
MRKLALETLESCKEYMPNLIQASENIALYFQTGQNQKAIELIPLYVDGLQWVLEAINGIRNNGVSLEINVENVMQHLPTMLEGLEANDFTLTADIIAYEITPTLQEWLRGMNEYQVN